MKTDPWSQHLAVCSWSLQPATPDDLFRSLDAVGLRRLQLALDPLREQPEVWGNFGALARERGVTLVSGMFGTVGEDYTTLESIKATGGLVPDATWHETWQHITQVAVIAEQLGLKLVTFHAGFLPHEDHDPDFAKLFARVSEVAELFAARGISLGFETGQETAPTLAHFLRKLHRPSVGVNFDPANMLLYDKGDPIAALRALAPHLKQCHLKDALRTQVPGTWGQEVTIGTGQVDWRAFFATLEAIGFHGDLCLEREAGTQRIADLRAGKEHVLSLT